MKISYMLEREDFYKINQETLNYFYTDDLHESILYIYPQLNAIVTKKPSKEVKRYLYVEYNVKSSFLKKVLVACYARISLNTNGFLSSSTCTVKGDFSECCLIYPCNKKFRIFDFKKKLVTVIPKIGFPDMDIKKEIQFRNNNHADFIPTIISSGLNYYTELIIDGYPLARAENDFQIKKDETRGIWKEYIRDSVREVRSEEYAQMLRRRYKELLKEENVKLKMIDRETLAKLEETLYSEMKRDEKVQIGTSHGDLQPGNIWIENKTGKIYIIEWETYGIRSIWYDECALDENLRMESGLKNISEIQDLKHTVVLYEVLIFRLEELNNLPYDYISKEFRRYVRIILKGRKDV